ncbi:MAG: helical backbone metal receptor [Ignavibacteria bacterium]|jgi:iron complex transport system substrate-binding protein
MKRMQLFGNVLLIVLLFFSTSCFTQKQQRIVSLAPNWTNIVAAVGAADELVGVTRYCIFPDSIPRLVEEGKLQVVAGFTDVNFEKVEELKPDLILTCTGVQAKARDRFLKEGYKVIHMEESSLDEVYSKISELGKAINKEENSDELVEELKSGLLLVADKYKKYPKVKVYYEINYYYKCLPGRDSYITELIKMVGGEPIYSDRAGIAPLVKWEEVVKANPDVILIPIWAQAGGPYFEGSKVGYGTTTPFEIAHREGAEKVNAVKNGKVRYINSAKTKQAGPQIVTAADLFGKTIHADGDLELLKMDKVPENMETAFSQLFRYFPFIIVNESLCSISK